MWAVAIRFKRHTINCLQMVSSAWLHRGVNGDLVDGMGLTFAGCAALRHMWDPKARRPETPAGPETA